MSDSLIDTESLRPAVDFRPVRFAPVDIAIEHRADGTLLLKNRLPLPDFPVRQIGQYLRMHATIRPASNFLAEPAAGDNWRYLTFQQARQQVDALSQWLIDQHIPADRPILILSDNSINHAVLQLAAIQIGIPVLAVSAAYSLMSEACAKIAELSQRFQPALIYADNPVRYGKALGVAKSKTNAVILCDQAAEGIADLTFSQALQTACTAAVDEAFERVQLDTLARLLLTSGSTGSPKAVMMTQRNLIASGLLWDTVWPFLNDQPPIMVDWLPWSHTAGSHGCLGMALRHGGTLYIDDGKPVAQHFDRTVRRLREIRPNVMCNVPRSLDLLVARMDEDDSFAEAFFANMQVIVYGGAALSADTLLKLEKHSARATGLRMPVSASLGSTETTMPATLIWWNPKTLGGLGLPGPGVEAKLVPDGERYEIRFRGPSITPGYYRDPTANQKTFDEEGFLKTGDAVTFANPDVPEDGLVYSGRLSENFKLSSGTWVSVASVRAELLAALHPYVSDVVLAEPNRAELGALLFLNTAQIRKAFPALGTATESTMAQHPYVHEHVDHAIRLYNARFPGNSTRIARAAILCHPPNIDKGEITDKGHINQRAVLTERAEKVQQLYALTQNTADCLIFDSADQGFDYAQQRAKPDAEIALK